MSNSDIPATVGRYEVDRLLGAGAMGLVYLGRDPELDRLVAIKTVRDLDLEDDAKATFIERFKNEARAAARLHHPSIVQVYDVGEDDRVGPFLVFEYVQGSTLKQVLRAEGPLPAERLLVLASQVAEAIDTAHAAGIIHRDIKPDNLLLAGSGRTKLADFGVARVPNAALTREGQFLGTPCYAAPETLEHAQYSVASDLFSFAAVLYEALSGVRAYPGDDAVAVAHKVIHESPPPPSKASRDAPVEADAALLRGLTRRPEDRPGSARELVGELADALAMAGRIDRRRAAELTAGATLGDLAGRRGGGRTATFAFFGVLLGALGAGVALVLVFSQGDGPAPSRDLSALFGDERDAATGDPSEDAGPSDTDDGGRGGVDPDEDEDDGGPDDALDGGEVPDADLVDGGDGGATPVPLTAHEREEAAKDALDRARRAIEIGDWSAAEAALGEARRFDPENPDVGREEASLATGRAAADTAEGEDAPAPDDEATAPD